MGSVCVCVIAAWLTVNLIVLLVALHCGWRGKPQKEPIGIGSEPASGRVVSLPVGSRLHFMSTKQPPTPRCLNCARPMQLPARSMASAPPLQRNCSIKKISAAARSEW